MNKGINKPNVEKLAELVDIPLPTPEQASMVEGQLNFTAQQEIESMESLQEFEGLWDKIRQTQSEAENLGELPFRDKMTKLQLDAEDIYELVSFAMDDQQRSDEAETNFVVFNEGRGNKNTKPLGSSGSSKRHLKLKDFEAYMDTKYPVGRSFVCIDYVLGPLEYQSNPTKLRVVPESVSAPKKINVEDLIVTDPKILLAEGFVVTPTNEEIKIEDLKVTPKVIEAEVDDEVDEAVNSNLTEINLMLLDVCASQNNMNNDEALSLMLTNYIRQGKHVIDTAKQYPRISLELVKEAIEKNDIVFSKP